MRWRFFGLQRTIDEVFVDGWIYPGQPDAARIATAQGVA